MESQRDAAEVNAELVEAETRLASLVENAGPYAVMLREAVDDVARLRGEQKVATDYSRLMEGILRDARSRGEIIERASVIATTVVTSAMSMDSLSHSGADYEGGSPTTVESICREAFDRSLRIQLSILGLSADPSNWKMPI